MNGLKTGQSKRAKNVIFWTSEYYYVDPYSSAMLFQIIAVILCALNNRLDIRCFQAPLCSTRPDVMKPTALLIF